MKKWILGISALATVVAPVATAAACGGKSIAKSSTEVNKWKNTAEQLEKTIKDLQDKINSLESKVVSGENVNHELETAKNELNKAKEELAKVNQNSLASIRKQFDASLVPFTVNQYQMDHDALIDSLKPKVEHDAEGYVAKRQVTNLEKELATGFTNGKFMATVATIDNAENWTTLSAIEPINDANQHNAEDHTTYVLDDAFFSKSTVEKVAALEDLMFGKLTIDNKRLGGLVAVGQTENIVIEGTPLSNANGVTSVLYSIDESTKTLSVWTKDRIQTKLPTLDELIKAKTPNWKQDQNIVNELAKIGVNANDQITPDKYLQIIKYFYVPSSEAAAKLFANAHPWMDGYKMNASAEGFNVTQKMTSALTWNFDDYTINNLGLGSKQVIKKDGSVKRFDDSDFYTSTAASQYDADVWSDQFETYDGKVTSKGWIFDHIFNGLSLADGNNNWNGGGADRYHSYYDRKIDSIGFMGLTYSLLAATHQSPTNPNDQILDLSVKYIPSSKIMLRDSITLKGMQPNVAHMWDGKDAAFFGDGDVITQTDATREITTKEFMDSLVKAQSALKSFNALGSLFLKDPLIGNLISVISTINMSMITDETAKIIQDLLAQRTDINLNWFISTVNKPSAYVQSILLTDRKDDHYALSLKALQFDNVTNTLLAIARVVSPDAFTKGDLSHV